MAEPELIDRGTDTTGHTDTGRTGVIRPRAGHTTPRNPRSAMIRPQAAGTRRALLGLGCVTVLLAAPLTGCSLLAPKFVKPSLSVVKVTLGHSDLLQQHLVVRMRVQNPNDRELPVQGLEYVFEMGGEELAHGQSSASFVVPAHGEAEFDTAVTTNMATALLRLLGRGGNAPHEYRFHGKVQLSSGFIRSVPFEHTGMLDIR